jgi:hypothetical protein
VWDVFHRHANPETHYLSVADLQVSLASLIDNLNGDDDVTWFIRHVNAVDTGKLSFIKYLFLIPLSLSLSSSFQSSSSLPPSSLSSSLPPLLSSHPLLSFSLFIRIVFDEYRLVKGVGDLIDRKGPRKKRYVTL